MKWAHPLKGRTIREALADELAIVSGRRTDPVFLWVQAPIHRSSMFDCAAWGYSSSDLKMPQYHSWDTMRECLRYGFEIITDRAEISAKKPAPPTATELYQDWHTRYLTPKSLSKKHFFRLTTFGGGRATPERAIEQIQGVLDDRPKSIKVGYVATSIRGCHECLVVYTPSEPTP